MTATGGAVGSVLFHLLSPWWWTPIASNWSYIDNTITITFWITGFVFVAVLASWPIASSASITRKAREAAYQPENKRLEWWLAIGTALGVGAMLAPGLVVWNQFVTVPAGCRRDRGRRPAMAVELPAARNGRPAWARR
jgi:cytochrome c oxidase subunit 2